MTEQKDKQPLTEGQINEILSRQNPSSRWVQLSPTLQTKHLERIAGHLLIIGLLIGGIILDRSGAMKSPPVNPPKVEQPYQLPLSQK